MTTTDVAIREVMSPSLINQNKAAFLLKSIWRDAPEQEIVKAALICQQYQLNPLRKAVYIVKFGNQWVTMESINSTRQIARQGGHRWSYADGPRAMTEDEQQKILGEVDKSKFWAITIIEENGQRFPGYGNWPRNDKGELVAYGTDKGNTPQNMAFIRSERNAISRMAPGELPDETMPDQYTPITNLSAAVEAGKRELETEVSDEGIYPKDEPVIASSPVANTKKSDLYNWIRSHKAGYKDEQIEAWLKALSIPLEDIENHADLVRSEIVRTQGWK